MRQEMNKKTGRNEWILDRWYSKTTFMFGVLWLVLFVISMANASI
jgi:hypothetical protein